LSKTKPSQFSSVQLRRFERALSVKHFLLNGYFFVLYTDSYFCRVDHTQ